MQQAKDIFVEKFGYVPTISSFAPGRVNLIGEHTDYNDGFVLPFALPYRTTIVASKTTNGIGRVYSCAQRESVIVEFSIDDKLTIGEPSWANYIKGVVFMYLQDLPHGFGFDCVVTTAVPIGSGLSSSASLEVAIATMLETLCGGLSHISKVDKALRCQKAEHIFAAIPCGIMDQYISAMGSSGNLLLIDCRSKSFKLVPFGNTRNTPVIVITNSNVKHSLSGSEYPDRVRQCAQAVQILQTTFPQVIALRDATMDMLDSVKDQMSSTVYARARHCITEDERTLSTVAALSVGDYVTVGRNMTESHVSLKEDYEVSCEEIDFLVDLALQVPGVYGSRITGGGFGGCTVTLVDRDSVSTLQQFITDHYMKQTGRKCEFYVTEPSDGAGSISLTPVANSGANLDNTHHREKASVAWMDYAIPVAIVAVVLAATVAYRLTKN